MPALAPRRRRGAEILDDPGVLPELVVRSLEDVAAANRLFGGSRAVLRELAGVLDSIAPNDTITLLDVGTGLGDIPSAARRSAVRRRVGMEVYGVDSSEELLRARRDICITPVRADAIFLPFREAAFDVVLCSQLLHHYTDEDAPVVLRELNRVARLRVIISDIRRSWLAAAGIWLASFPLRFHRVSRHDGVVSVLRGFTRSELELLVRSALGAHPRVTTRVGFRITASWAPPRETKSE
jgi:SAM-dependent methyltransferase